MTKGYKDVDYQNRLEAAMSTLSVAQDMLDRVHSMLFCGGKETDADCDFATAKTLAEQLIRQINWLEDNWV